MIRGPEKVLRRHPPSYNRNISRAVRTPKSEGDISSVFVSLSGGATAPLDSRFAKLKRKLIRGHEDRLRESWKSLLRDLRDEAEIIQTSSTSVIPEIPFHHIRNVPLEVQNEVRKRGVAVIRGVVSEAEALDLKDDIQGYIKANPHSRAFPPDNPQVYELYWSPAQVRARSHPNLLQAQRFLMSFWHSTDPSAMISTDHPVSYADRLRIRNPGDATFALGPHVDGGSVERWEENGYGLGKVYDQIWNGQWQHYDPWESSARLPAVTDLYNGAGSCSMFRMFQGWLSMSDTGPGEGTLLVNPLLSKATAYFLLRPFFSPIRWSHDTAATAELLRPDNWQLEEKPTSTLQGATPSHCQELNDEWHPHLQLPGTMVHVPRVRPGDYVAWHCDTIHAVDSRHAGKTDSSVLYIPACPLTEANAEYLVRQRESFIQGTPAPDFPGGKGESEHVGRATIDYMKRAASEEGQAAMGLHEWADTKTQGTEGEHDIIQNCNRLLSL
ncbi:MAG: hypothetical protein M1817_000389 [Caeruleum heppii]|nr:MAG: hypothetical protein M1817_000389 [Caeruleum heppii]